MHIIFGEEQAQALADKYTVLELDTLRFGANGPVATAYCVIEQIAINDLPKVPSMKNLHSELMVNYRKRDWNFCTQALEHLTGFWGKESDSTISPIVIKAFSGIRMNPRVLKLIEFKYRH